MADGEAIQAAAAKKSDLGLRTLTAIAMVVVAGGALWLGGWFWAIFVALIAMGVLWEWRGLVRGFAKTALARLAWNAAGFVYIAFAAFVLLFLRMDYLGYGPVLVLIAAVVATDIGAYFMGRTIGGPKIAPRISPSKTWAGLAGGVLGASLAIAIYGFVTLSAVCAGQSWSGCIAGGPSPWLAALGVLLTGAVIAVVAQAGDFFESWMKRRAGVKDSGTLLPGHGGLFDRVDGLLALCFVWGLITFGSYLLDGA